MARLRLPVVVDRRSVLGGLATFALGCGSTESPPNDASNKDTGPDAGEDAPACAPTCTADDKTVVLSFADHPELANVGGSVKLEDPRYKDPVCGLDFIMVAQPTAGNYIALAGACTHSCCTISFNKTFFSCPCHGSRFNLAGKVTTGPATQALQLLSVCADDCAVYVQLP